MGRKTLLIPIVVLGVLLFAGAAIAANVRCDGGACRGTGKADKITGSSRPDRIKALGGSDRVGGGRGNDRIVAGAGADTVGGSYGRDKISGGEHNDRISGGFGGDRISAGGGTDNVFGESGNDHIVIAGDGANDFVDCGTGDNDVVVLDAQEQQPANPADFIAQTSCEDVRLATP